MPNENHHSEGAAGKAAYHRQCCSDGMLSHQSVGDRATEKARLWGCIFAQCADMHPCNTDKYCFGHLPPPCTASPTPQLRAHLRLLVVMIFAKGERNCTGRTVSEHLANRKAGKAHNKHAQMLTFSVARSPRRVIPRQDPLHLLLNFGALLLVGARPVPSAPISQAAFRRSKGRLFRQPALLVL